MALRIRLARFGQKKRPFYRIVVQEHETARNGRFHEIVGTLNPMTDPATVELKEERIKHWVAKGAHATSRVADVIKQKIPNLLEEREERQTAKIQAARKARKERAKARA